MADPSRGGGTGDELHQAFGGFLADVDAIGDADQVGVLELDAGALIAVVEQDVETGGFEFGGDLFAGAEQGRVGNVGDGDDDIEGRDGRVAARSRWRHCDCSMAAVRMRSMPMP